MLLLTVSKKFFLSTTGGSDLEHNEYVGEVSTLMRLLTTKGSDLSSNFDKNGEKALNDNDILKHILFNKHTETTNQGKIKGHLTLEHIIGFCKIFWKITKILGFHLIFKMNDLQDNVFTTIATDLNVTIESFHLYFPI